MLRVLEIAPITIFWKKKFIFFKVIRSKWSQNIPLFARNVVSFGNRAKKQFFGLKVILSKWSQNMVLFARNVDSYETKVLNSMLNSLGDNVKKLIFGQKSKLNIVLFPRNIDSLWDKAKTQFFGAKIHFFEVISKYRHIFPEMLIFWAKIYFIQVISKCGPFFPEMFIVLEIKLVFS